MSAKGSRLVLVVALVALWLAGCGSAGPSGSLQGGDKAPDIIINGCNNNGAPYGAGSGTSHSPYLLCTPAHLLAMTKHLGTTEFFRLATDIVVPADATAGSAQDFRGDLDGAGHYISGVTGLPFIQNNAGRIHDLELRDIALLASNDVGGIVGTNAVGGIVEDCTANGKIRAAYTVGGLVGFNDGEVRRSSANVAIRATDHVGGLVGFNRGTIDQSFSASSVDGSETMLGGLVSESSGGSITDSYAHGSVRGRAKIAALVAINDGSIARCYADGPLTVTGTDFTKSGGLVGNGAGTVVDSYWNTQSTGMSTSSGGTGATSSDLLNQGTFHGWDFTLVWQMPSNATPAFR